MPALPDAPAALKVQVFGSYGPANWANVMYLQFSAAGNPTTADLNSLSTQFMTAYQLLGNLMHTTCSVSQVTITDVSSRTGNQGTAVTGFAGIKAGTALPASVAICLTKTIARRYRGGHPRMYLPGQVTADTQDSRTWNTTATAAALTRANLFYAQVNGLTTATSGLCKLANVSYWFTSPPKTPPQLRPVPLVELITGFKVDNRIDSQRRRLY